jgi:hypothetical protein
VTGVQVAASLLDRTILNHYNTGLETIARRGFYPFLSESSKPYIDAVWNNFSTARPTITEDILHGRASGRAWKWLRSWFQSNPVKGNLSDGPAESIQD